MLRSKYREEKRREEKPDRITYHRTGIVAIVVVAVHGHHCRLGMFGASMQLTDYAIDEPAKTTETAIGDLSANVVRIEA